MPTLPSSLDGTWKLIRAELDGEAMPESVAMKTELTLAAGTYIVRFAGEIVDRGTFEIGSSAEARTITLHGTEGPNAGRTIPSIYQLAGDRLRVCYGLRGVAPTEFVTTGGDQHYLAMYRRVPQRTPASST